MLRRATAALPDARAVRSIGVASIGEAGVLLGGDGRPLAPSSPGTTRAPRASSRLLSSIGFEQLHRLTGLCPDPTFSLPKLLWQQRHQPEAFRPARHWLNVGDFLAWRLSGELATDLSLASRTLLLDLERQLGERRCSMPRGSGPGSCRPSWPAAPSWGGSPPRQPRRPGCRRTSWSASAGMTMSAAARRRGRPAGRAAGQHGHGRSPDLQSTHRHRCRLRPARLQPGCRQGRPAAVLRLWRPADLGRRRRMVPRHHGGGVDHATLDRRGRDAYRPGSDGVLFLPHLRIGSPPFPDPMARGAFIGLQRPRSHRGDAVSRRARGPGPGRRPSCCAPCTGHLGRRRHGRIRRSAAAPGTGC